MSSASHWSGQLTRAWLQKGWLARLLWPLSVLYAALMVARTWAYRHGVFKTQRCAVPVVVVGNVVAGGAGKTPVVIGVVTHLAQRGHVPGVISRGYGRVADGEQDTPLEVHNRSDALNVGDEPVLIHRTTGVPVFVARNRYAAAQALLTAYPSTTVIVCDDGLQHLGLHADVSIAVFDERGTGNGWLLPAGLLRERWPSGTGRAVDLVLHATPAEAHHGQTIAPPRPDAPVYTAYKTLATQAYNPAGQHVPLANLSHAPATALAGIAKPEVFFDMLRSHHLTLSATWSLPDHHRPDAEFNSKLLNILKREEVFLTEKDAVKLFPNWRTSAPTPLPPELAAHAMPGEQSHHMWAVPLALHIEPAFFAALDAKLSSAHGHQTA
ncbi:MAG: tetraacyldisaccharide 4'-kinase [Burkholderiales bacterium]|nr:tetraacyldisaccharide 4'-kinase [Burkholderiales bacterium]